MDPRTTDPIPGAVRFGPSDRPPGTGADERRLWTDLWMNCGQRRETCAGNRRKSRKATSLKIWMLPGINVGTDGFADLYNHRRPHGALKGRTPAEYLETIAESGNPESLN